MISLSPCRPNFPHFFDFDYFALPTDLHELKVAMLRFVTNLYLQPFSSRQSNGGGGEHGLLGFFFFSVQNQSTIFSAREQIEKHRDFFLTKLQYSAILSTGFPFVRQNFVRPSPRLWIFR